ncbi:ABC transporter substrate-binding protein [Orrella dioscoreae]|uniref:ABC transporter substrate-binding protein n=1 Tax=Orrella dioscoreae TaxID=1851544 RepID=UPI0012FFF340|nr:ABC transporter substrate-binding protein [Orrella dioscoreae]
MPIPRIEWRAPLLAAMLGWSALSGAFAQTPDAGAYPVTVTDVAGRDVHLAREPRRIFLQNGGHLLALALLNREDPFAGLVAWENNLGNSDPTIWNLMRQRWPQGGQVPELHFDASGNADLERLVRMKPDLLVLELRARPAVERGPAQAVLAALNIPILYVDASIDPLGNTPRTIRALGQAVGQQARAEEYLAFHAARWQALQAGITQPREAGMAAPRVFIESRAGRLGLDQCCYSQGRTSWGQMVDAAGGSNYATPLLRGSTGDIALERLIRDRPDHYVMTGTARVRRGARVIPFGYGATREAAAAVMADLMARPAFRLVARTPADCAQGLYHQFYTSAYNIAALEYLGRMMYPATLGHLDPAGTYREIIRRYTQIPDAPFLFHLSRGFGDGRDCEKDAAG